ncbi:10202_t:CDS:2 [Funneliformis geosporum]|nr:10202_t:CDS:2 [Funneliformis geosporum]
MPYKFNLIYRASKDGMTQAAFHQKCDNKGATIVIIKIRGSEQLVGGYNPLVWDSSDTWKYAYDSFIFSFKNGNTFNFGYSNGGGNSIGCHSNYGPSFHNDLRLDKNGFWKRMLICAVKLNIEFKAS